MKKFFAFLLFLLSPTFILAHGFDNGDCGPGWGAWPFHHFYLGGPIMGIIILIIIIVGFYFLLRNKGNINKSNQTPLDILKTRYARGEISKDEFEEMKKNL